MTLSKQDYQLVAQVLNRYYNNRGLAQATDGNAASLVHWIAFDLASEFTKQNPRFNDEKWWEAVEGSPPLELG